MLYHPSMKSFDVFLNKAIKTLLVVNIIIMLTIGAFFVQPVYAVNDSLNDTIVPNVDFVYNSVNASYVVSNGQPYYADRYYVIRASSGSDFVDSDVYVFSVDDLYLYFVSESQLDYSIAYTYSNNSNVAKYSYPTQTTDFNSTYNFYYTRGTTLGTPNHIPNFSSIDEGLQAVRDYIDNSANPPVSYEGFRLPSGYACAIQGRNVSFDLTTDMPEYSSLKQWAYSTQRYGLESALPETASFDYDYGTRIIWSITGDTNLLGEGYHASASLSVNPSGYLILVNPTYYGSTANIMSADMFNSTVTLSNVQGVTSIRLFSLGSYIGSGGITSDFSPDSSVYDKSVVASGGAFYLDNGDGTYTPISDLPQFGDTSTDGSNSGLIAKFRAILEGFVESIESLLIAPVSYIQRIISAGQTFFTWLSGLWSWLPGPVSGIITSVLYVMAVVGALKLLWR